MFPRFLQPPHSCVKHGKLFIYMGSFPQPRHFFAAAQENKDFGALRMGPSMPSKYKLFVDTKNSALRTSGFEGSKFLQKC